MAVRVIRIGSKLYDNYFFDKLIMMQQHSDMTLQQPQYMSNIVANAKEMASGSGSRVNKDPESLLRYGLPIKNNEVCIWKKYL